MNKTLELRLSAPAESLPELLAHPLLNDSAPAGDWPAIDDLYFDTPNRRLHERRIALLVRDDGQGRRQCTRVPAPEFAGLGEPRVAVRDYGDGFDFSDLDDPDLTHFLERHAARLAPVFRTRYRRRSFRFTPAAGTPIRVSLDEGQLSAGEEVQSFCEVVLRAITADRADLLAFAARLAADLPLLPTDRSRAEAGYRLLDPEPPLPLRAEDSPLLGVETVDEAFTAIAGSSLRLWLGNAEAALDQGPAADPEFVHQIRVGLRRLRSALRVFAPVLGETFAADWRERLGGHARGLDAARDLDVFRAELLDPVITTGLLGDDALAHLGQRVAAARQAAETAPGTGLEQGREGRMILAFAAALNGLEPAAWDTPADLDAFAACGLHKLRQRARRRFSIASNLAPPALHRLRIALKDLRYAAEFFAPLFPGQAVRDYLGLLTRAQSALGFLHDLDVARIRLETWAVEDPTLAGPAGFVLGWHAPRYDRVRHRVLRDCAPALWDKPYWRRARRAG